ncbi:hypothetical protein JZO70_17325 [Enterococcus sp. 669A]|uniref:Transposase n=1 Tax=Candidatus Enterococcus moelleringii TaxID=2815325 RepID=A0ABS3LE89_9ENTE|nr:hypothetical protein [Enterococcus sp. 669A]MBO1307940.1 hypothetical protein [Enterococcus sp. 669A]
MIMDMNKAKMVNDAVVSTLERKAKEAGREEEKYEIALNMLEEKEPIEKIVKYTDLTIEQIKELRTELD